MFLSTTKSGYNRHDEQVAHGPFLIVAQHPNGEPGLRAIVRHARLRQWGHWMMGTVPIGQERVTLSGCYGSDGLPCQVSESVWNRMHPVPSDIERTFWAGGGPEMPTMRKWATENIGKLR